MILQEAQDLYSRNPWGVITIIAIAVAVFLAIIVLRPPASSLPPLPAATQRIYVTVSPYLARKGSRVDVAPRGRAKRRGSGSDQPSAVPTHPKGTTHASTSHTPTVTPSDTPSIAPTPTGGPTPTTPAGPPQRIGI